MILPNGNDLFGGTQQGRQMEQNGMIDSILSGRFLRMTWRSKSGLTEISPVNGRSCEAINGIDTATPVAKVPIAAAAAPRLSL